MTADASRLIELATAAWESIGTPARILAALRAGGLASLSEAEDSLDGERRVRATENSRDLVERGVGVLIYGQPGYPAALAAHRSPPPLLFYKGDPSILEFSAVGMCGSRSASDAGLRAAEACGMAVAREGLTIVSGYARGVDTETHLAALRSDGRTIVVLAEGILHFRVKKTFSDDFDETRVLVLSQFPPRQPWSAGGAMVRNAVIAGLGRALVVIEAHDKGGTLDAGLQALAMGRPVLALEFESSPTPEGNSILIRKGAIPVRRPAQLRAVIAALRDPSSSGDQLSLALG
jgi:DNA processing protein